MIAQLSGTVSEISGNVVTLDVHGVGYEVHCSRACVQRLEPKSAVRVVIHTEVKEDSIKLYGFGDQLEKQVFLLLMEVKGVGARSGSEIVSKIDKVDLLRLIGAGDVGGLQAVKGIGKKTAERIVVELKDRVGAYAVERHSASSGAPQGTLQPFQEAIEVLQALGFNRKDAERSVRQVEGYEKNDDAARLVKEALKFV